MDAPSFEVFRYRDLYLKEVELHSHDFYEVYLFLSGNVKYSIEGRIYELEPGDLLLISPLELHQPMVEWENKPYGRIVLWINQDYLRRLSTPGTDLTLCFDVASPNHTNLLRLEETDRKIITSQMERLVQESASTQYGGDLNALALLLQLLVSMNRLAAATPRRYEITDKSGIAVAEVLDYINAHYDEDLSLDGLAARFFISKYYLSHEFSRLVGTSVYRYIMKKRLIIAKKVLSEGISPVDACRYCGFGDYTNFYRAFRAEYRISPKEFYNSARLAAGGGRPVP